MPEIARMQDRQDKDKAEADRGSGPGKLTKMARAPAGAETGHASPEPAHAAGDSRPEDRQEAGQGPEAEPGTVQQLVAEFLAEQTRQGMDAFGACARAGSWTDVADAQGRLVADSLTRIGRFNLRCGELLLRGMTTVPAAFRR